MSAIRIISPEVIVKFSGNQQKTGGSLFRGAFIERMYRENFTLNACTLKTNDCD